MKLLNVLTAACFYFAAPLTGEPVSIKEASLPSFHSINPAATPIANKIDPAWLIRHNRKVKELDAHPYDVVFIGDSITQSLEVDGPEPWRMMKQVWDRYYAPFDAINLGFNGDTTANVLWRLSNGELPPYRPKAIVLEIGTNNIGSFNWSSEQTLTGIKAIIDMLQERFPDVNIILLTLLPCEFISPSELAKTNDALIKSYADSRSVSVVDLTSLFLRNGQIDKSQYLESRSRKPMKVIHPTAAAQERIAKMLEPVLKKVVAQVP